MLTPTEWVSPIITAMKSIGQIRICGDYNKFMYNDHFPLPKFEEICEKLRSSVIDQRITVENLTNRYQDIFEDDNGARGRTNIVRHRIDTGNARPIRQVPIRLPLSKREETGQIIKEMEQDGVIEPSNSLWGVSNGSCVEER